MRAVVKYHIVSYTVIKSLLLQLFLCIKLYVNKNLILPNNLGSSDISSDMTIMKSKQP